MRKKRRLKKHIKKRIKQVLVAVALSVAGYAAYQPFSSSASAGVTDCRDTVVMPDDTIASSVLNGAIQSFVGSRAMSGASVGVCVMDIRNGYVVGGYNVDKKFIPASVTKLVTSASALKHLTENYRFRTRVKYTGELTEDGTIQGDLIVEGGLDPTLGSRYLDEDHEGFLPALVETLRLWGVKRIAGRIRTEEQVKTLRQAYPSDWLDSDVTEYYGAGVYSLNYNDNLFSLIFDTSGGKVSIVDTIPHVVTFEIDNNMRAGTARNGRWLPAASRAKYSEKFRLNGTIRLSEDPLELEMPAIYPSEGLKADIRETLEAEGIVVEGKKTDTAGVSSFQLLSYESPVLPEVIKSLLHRSDNMYAESVLRALGQHCKGQGMREASIAAEAEVLGQWNIDLSGESLYDGSGLARANRMSPRFLTSVLRTAARDWQCGELFPTLLPVAGENGTVKKLLRETSLSGHIALKSGSMRGVKCYSGYYPAERPRYAVTLMVNRYRCNGEQLKKSIEQLFVDMFGDYQVDVIAKTLPAEQNKENN